MLILLLLTTRVGLIVQTLSKTASLYLTIIHPQPSNIPVY